MRFSIAGALVCPLLLQGVALSQEAYKSGQAGTDTSRLSTMQFSRNLQTFLWTGRIAYEARWQDLEIDWDQNLRSRLIRSVRNSTQDELGTRVSVRLHPEKPWGFDGVIRSAVLTDNRQLDLGNLSQHRVLTGPRYRSGGFSASVLGGFEFASQEQLRDRGFSFEASLLGKEVPVSDFDLLFDARSGRSFLEPRRLGSDDLSVAIVREYGNATVNALHVSYGRLQREFYTVADPDVRRDVQRSHNVFRRIESGFAVSDTLRYRSGPGSEFTVHAGYGSRTIERGYRYRSVSNPSSVLLDSRIEETRLFGGIAVWSEWGGWLRTGANVTHEEREERHGIIRSDAVPPQIVDQQERSARRLTNVARRSSIGLDVQSRLSGRDQLNFSGSAGILRYDTPDSLNTDDRDELLLVAGIEAIHDFGSGLVLSVLGDATLSHLVYLSRFQSANNNWNRIFRFRPRVEFAPVAWLTTVNSAEVMANYTVYDFEEQVASVRSFSFRQASWSDSTAVRLGPRTELLLLASLRLYERGILQWNAFTERPEHYFVEESYWPQVIVGVADHLLLGVGYRYFAQTRFRYEGRRRVFEQKLVNEGPTVRLFWHGSGSKSVSLEGWREAQSSAGETRTYSNLSIIVGMTL